MVYFPLALLDVCTPISVQVTLARLLIVVGNTSAGRLAMGDLILARIDRCPRVFVSCFCLLVSCPYAFIACLRFLYPPHSALLYFFLFLTIDSQYLVFSLFLVSCPDSLLSPLLSADGPSLSPFPKYPTGPPRREGKRGGT